MVRDRPFGAEPASAHMERLCAWTLIVLGAMLRFAYAFHHDVNTDEPQHLHVAWCWTQGLLPYRDFFDNHSPLFSMLFAPVLGWVGERPDIVICMRYAMVPLALLTLWITWILGRRLFGTRAALWTVAAVGVHPDFIAKGVEYRTDVLWMALWASTLAVLLVNRPTRVRGFVGGVLLGATFAASMKTTLLVLALVLASIATAAIVQTSTRMNWRCHARTIGATLAGLIVVPAAFAGFFAWQRAWSPMINGLILHNYVPGLGRWGSRPWLPFLMIAATPGLLWCARQIVRSARDRGIGALRSVLFLTSAFYWLGVHTLWPLVTRQDSLPLVPMAAALVVPLVMWFLKFLQSHSKVPSAWARPTWVVLSLLVVAEGVSATAAEPAWKDKTLLQRRTLSDLLRLTRRTEPVMDVRGEAIFRSRPTYSVFEAVTLARIQQGLLRDDIAERVLVSRAAIAYRDIDEWPPRGREFLNHHYISVGRWRVLGQWLKPPRPGADVGMFDILIPQRYTIVTARGTPRGALDGTPFAGPRNLAVGPHIYRAAQGENPVAVIWAPAIDRGFKPYSR